MTEMMKIIHENALQLRFSELEYLELYTGTLHRNIMAIYSLWAKAITRSQKNSQIIYFTKHKTTTANHKHIRNHCNWCHKQSKMKCGYAVHIRKSEKLLYINIATFTDSQNNNRLPYHNKLILHF